MEKKIKVVWLCHFSDKKTRCNLTFSRFYYHRIIRWILRKNTNIYVDFASWITNAIKVFESFDDIDLTIVFPHIGIKGKSQRFDINGIHYIAFRSETDYFLPYIKERIFGKPEKSFKKNRVLISSVIKEVEPDIVHIIGAENSYYSIAALDIPNTIPSIISLQTLLSMPEFMGNYPVTKQWYEFHSQLEKDIIKKCTYVGSTSKLFTDFVRSNMCPEAVILKMPLAVGVEIELSYSKKEYDFVYFAANISKAADYAIEAFALAYKQRPDLTLNISGSYSVDFKNWIDKRAEELGISDAVFISGGKSTHEEVIKQIKKSKYALLPLKVDLISGTIREAIACGLPVVSTITPATPVLNRDRESVLLSEKGDFQAMADNMLRLVNDDSFASRIRENAIVTVREKYSNEHFMQQWQKAYHEVVDNYRRGVSFTEEIVQV